MNRTSIIALAVLTLVLSGCGASQKLSRPTGSAPVPTAHGADAPATAERLMQPSTQAKPGRQAEPLLRSTERPDDPFDLPPQ